MFGYIVVNKSEMKFKEFDKYHSYYCGLCRGLKEKYGKAGQLTLSYDMTFLLILLSGLYEPETKLADDRCLIHPFEKHQIRTNIFTEYIADMNLLFSYYKCLDDWEDEKKVHQLILGKILEGKSGKYNNIYAKKIRKIEHLMYDFSKAEKDGVKNIDTMAGMFGEIMGEIVAYKEDEWHENLYRLGFYLGKFVYLLDAYEDVEDDIAKNRYNPLKYKFLEVNFEEECRTILIMMMSECCREFEKLPIIENVEILRNILYSGVWCRYEAVREKRIKQKTYKTKESINE